MTFQMILQKIQTYAHHASDTYQDAINAATIRLQRLFQNLKKENKNLRADLFRAEQLNAMQRGRIAALEDVLGDLQEQHRELGALLTQTIHARQRDTQVIAELEADLAGLHVQLTGAEIEIDVLQQALTESHLKNAALKQEK